MKNITIAILLLISSLIFSQNKQSLPLNENFDSSSSLPTGWTLETSTYNWEIQNWGEGKAIVNPWDGTNDKSGWFFTPGLELTGGVVYFIKFMMKAPGIDGSVESLRLKAGTSATSSSMTELLFEDENIADGVFTEYIFPFTPSTDGTYYFGWQAFTPAAQDYIAIDDISIYEAPEIDISIKNSKLPVASLIANSPNSNIIVQNLGNQTKTFDAKLIVNNGTSDIHTETITITNLGVTEKQEINFTDFNLNSEGTYTYLYSIILSGTDANSLDNNLNKEVNVIDGCNHKLQMATVMQPWGWLGATMSITSNGINVLTSVTLINGSSENIYFPSSEDANIEIDFDNLGEWQTNCHWEIFDGENNSLISGTGSTSGSNIVQNVTGNCAPASINSVYDEQNITITTKNYNIDIQTNNNYNLSIFDLLGRNIMNKKVIGNTNIKINKKGIYLLKFNNDTTSFTQKVNIK